MNCNLTSIDGRIPATTEFSAFVFIDVRFAAPFLTSTCQGGFAPLSFSDLLTNIRKLFGITIIIVPLARSPHFDTILIISLL